MASRILTVTELNQFIKRVFESNSILRRVEVEGEISSLKRASSGHYYFTLKDSQCEIHCNLWRSVAAKLRFQLQDGLQVKVSGSVEAYPQRGSYSIIVNKIEPAGIGSLYMLYQNYLRDLNEKGWLKEELKKALPENIKKVGIVTSETGAVIHDILTTIRRRNPLLEIQLVPALVQGEGAAESIAAGIEQLNKNNEVDVIIVGRGGGSMEDLWAFNEPAVAEAIFNSEIPVISAVGHETDVLISDFVADLRAPTPTAAAEFVSNDFIRVQNWLELIGSEMYQSLVNNYNSKLNRITEIKRRLLLLSPESKLVQNQFKVDELDVRMQNLIERKISTLKNKVDSLKLRIELLNPKFMFERGFTMVTNNENEIVRSAEQAKKDKTLTIHFKDGNVTTEVKE